MLKLFRCFLLCCIFFVVVDVHAANPVIRRTECGVELRNDHVSITFSNDAELISIIDLEKNINIAEKGNKIAFAKTLKGSFIEASKLTLKDNNLEIAIGKNCIIVKVHAYHDYFTLEVQNDSIPGIDMLAFIDLKLKPNKISESFLCATGVAMSLQTYSVNYPSINNEEVLGKCYLHTGFKGAKLAIVACRNGELWNNVKRIYSSIPSYCVPQLSTGGAFAHNGLANRDDCVIVGGADVKKENVPEWIDFYSKIGVCQIAFHVGYSTFIQGQFSFPKYGSALVFKEQITNPLSVEGFISILHTYAYYISDLSEDILSDPKWQQQLEFRGEYILTKSVTAEDEYIDLLNDKSLINKVVSDNSVCTPYFLIDNEIVKYIESQNGLVLCKRGQCGTIPSSHKKGAKIQIIGGYFGYMAPQIGSELFYEIARRTAEAYNNGGFRGLYIDALDGLPVHLAHAGLNDYKWYYGAAFINEILKYCKTEPQIIECSTLYPSIWSARGRGESWDTPCRGYKNFIDDHITRNIYLMDYNYIGVLGWYDFYPIKDDEPKDFSTKYMFFDDVDYLGVKAITYDQTMIYNRLYKRKVDDIPALKRNLNLYAQYTKLRKSNYFSEKVKRILKDGKYEYHLICKNGKWGFREAVYNRAKLRDIELDSFEGVNPFKSQEPFIRLENLYTSEGKKSINLFSSEKKIYKGGKKEKVFPMPLDLKDYQALKVSLAGKGSCSKEAICVRLLPANMAGYADYIIKLNFDGVREIVIPNLDNAEYPENTFIGMDDDRYYMHRNPVDFSQISKIQLYLSEGCDNVELQSIDAVPIETNTISNPTINFENASICFIGDIQSGEYIEYCGGENKAMVYDNLGNSRLIDVRKKGRFIAPKGSFVANVTGFPELENAPIEICLTLGFYGKFIHN